MQKKLISKTRAAGQEFSTAPAAKKPNREEIARRAYELYVARGRAEGHEMEDWFRAERELSGKAHRNN